MFNAEIIMYDEETVESLKSFAENLAASMKYTGVAIKQVLAEMKTQLGWYRPNKLATRRGVRGRALALKWRRT